MTKGKNVVFMKAGESLKEVGKKGKLYKNVINIGKLEANVTHMLPGMKSKPYEHKGEEIHVVTRGTVEFHVGEEKFEMEEGDMLYHRSDIPHRAINRGKFEAVYITISTPPSFTLFK